MCPKSDDEEKEDVISHTSTMYSNVKHVIVDLCTPTLAIRDRSLIVRRGGGVGLQKGEIAGLKLFALPLPP